MTKEYLLEYFEQIKIIKPFQNLFHQLCGLELEVRRLNGACLKLSQVSAPRSALPVKILSQNQCQCDLRSKNCQHIPPEILSEVVTSKETKIFTCSSGYKKVLVPITLNEEVVGFLFTGENFSIRLDNVQMNSISDLLMQFTGYIIKYEVNSMENFQGSSLTHQQARLNKAIRYIQENYHKDISLRQVSSDSGVSYHYLSRLFKKELKTTFAQYKNKVRLDVAAKLLKDHRSTIS